MEYRNSFSDTFNTNQCSYLSTAVMGGTELMISVSVSNVAAVPRVPGVEGISSWGSSGQPNASFVLV